MEENLQFQYKNLSKRERRKLWRQENAKRRSLGRLLKTVIIVFFILGVIGFIGWWGMKFYNKSESTAAASNIGGAAPEFNLPSTTGETVALSQYKGNKNVLIYFHEGLTCDPCIRQMPELEKTLDEFEKMNVAILHVTFDPVDKLKEAQSRYNIKSPILSYDSAKTEVDYDLTRFSMGMGRRAGHTFILVGPDGTIKWRKDYWPGRGHMVAGGTMFVESKEILEQVKTALQ